jgi:hypothetical protein
VDRYSQSKFSGTKLRAIYLKMSMPFRAYYATSLEPPFAQTDRKNHLLTVITISIDADSKYLSTGINFVRFE